MEIRLLSFLGLFFYIVSSHLLDKELTVKEVPTELNEKEVKVNQEEVRRKVALNDSLLCLWAIGCRQNSGITHISYARLCIHHSASYRLNGSIFCCCLHFLCS